MKRPSTIHILIMAIMLTIVVLLNVIRGDVNLPYMITAILIILTYGIVNMLKQDNKCENTDIKEWVIEYPSFKMTPKES